MGQGIPFVLNDEHPSQQQSQVALPGETLPGPQSELMYDSAGFAARIVTAE